MATNINNFEDVIDSRDLVERIDELSEDVENLNPEIVTGKLDAVG